MSPPRPISNLRWWICGLLFASTVINYIDRQTLSVLAPYLKRDYGWTNTDFAKIVIAFRLAYAIGQSVCGRLMDRLGTRRGLTISVLWYSAVAMLTSLATGLRSFSDREDTDASEAGLSRPSWIDLLKFRQTWGAIASRALTDPIWFFITDWFAIFLVAKGFKLEDSLIAFWIPFIGSDLGNFAGGGVSSWLVRRGWPVGRARKAVVVPGAIGMASLMAALWASNLYVIAGLFGLSTFAYAALSTMANTFPADLFPSESVATVSGMSGTGAGIGTILSTYLIGYVSDRYSFGPVLIGASLVPLLAMALVLLLVRNTAESGRGRVRMI